MGFGKTAALITAVEKLFARKQIKKLLIVSTFLVSKETWPEELNTWEHASKLKFINIAGDAEDRIQKAISPAHIYIINQELFVWLAEKAGKKWPYDMIVFDDVAGFKSGVRKSKNVWCAFKDICPLYKNKKPYGCQLVERCRFARNCPAAASCPRSEGCKAYKPGPARLTRFGAVCVLRKQIKRIVHLTGTPTSKGGLDLWPLVYSLDGGKRLGRTFTDYKQRYFNRTPDGFNWTLKSNAGKVIADKIKDICVSIPSEAKLPPCHHIEYEIKLPKNAEKIYKEFARDMILSLPENGEEIEAANAGVLAGKLLQVCGGAVFKEQIEGQPKEWVQIHDEKIKAVGTLIKKHAREPIFVGYNFTHELTRLKQTFPHGVDIRKRKNVVNDWNAGRIPLMFGHPGSAGHGLNLQKGPGRVLIWLGLNWSLDLNKQLNKRLHRPGQKRVVYIYYLIAKGKADTDVMNGVAKYDYTQLQLLEAVRRNAKKGILK